MLKLCLQDNFDNDDKRQSHKILSQVYPQCEKPTKFFSAILKKINDTAQFDTLLKINEDGNGNKIERTLEKKDKIEEEVCLFYENLQAQKSVEHSKEEVKNCIGEDLKVITDDEKEKLEQDINKEELNYCIKNTKNNILPGASGYTEAFYKVFCRLLKYIVQDAIH